MAIDFAVLKNELLTDPAALGYATPIADGSMSTLAGLINAIRVGPTYAIWRGLIEGREVVQAIDPTEFVTFTQLQIMRLMLICSATGGLDSGSAQVRTLVTEAMPSGSTISRAAMVAMAKRQGSRAEVVFGPGIVLTSDELITALRS